MNNEILNLPNSEGWWCRSKDGYLPGDELCLEVSNVWEGGAVVHYGRDCSEIHDKNNFDSEWFYNMEWIKAISPWENL